MPRQLKCDRVLCLTILALMFFGLVMVFSATTGSADGSLRFVFKQAISAGIGLVAMRFFMFVDYHKLGVQRTVYLVVGGTIALLCVALFVNETANTHRFLRIWVFSIQPSEFAKLAAVLFLAFYLAKRSDEILDWRTLGAAGFVVGALCVLILGGRDLGTAALVLVIAGAILWVAGVKPSYFFIGGLVVALPLAAAVATEPYRLERITTFLHPERDPLGAGYQIQQSQIAVATGGFTGQGLMAGKQKMDFLPAAHTDFMFAVICEELGLIGGSLVVLAFFIILWRGIAIALRAPDPLGCYLAAGITAMIVCQAMINLGVVLAMLPTKGIPLPFVSYGGTAIVVALAASGVLLNVSQQAD